VSEWKQENITKQSDEKCVHLVFGLSVSFYAKGHYLVMLKWNILEVINQFQNRNTVIVEKDGERADISVVLYAYCWTILVLYYMHQLADHRFTNRRDTLYSRGGF